MIIFWQISSFKQVIFGIIMENDLPEMTEEFFTENKNHFQKINSQKKKGGPYSKHHRDKRREEVYRLHFDYGYPARKIAKLLNKSRNTINHDLNFCYTEITKNYNFIDPSLPVTFGLERLENQRIRIREQIEKTTKISEKRSFERLLYDIESKIISIRYKLIDSFYSINKLAENKANEFLKENNYKGRVLSFYDYLWSTDKAQMKIAKILAEEKKGYNH